MKKGHLGGLLFLLSLACLALGLAARADFENGSRTRHASAMSRNPGNEYREAFVTLKSPYDRTMQAPHIYCDYGGSYAVYPVTDCTGKKGEVVTVMYAYDHDDTYRLWETVRAALDTVSMNEDPSGAGRRTGYQVRGTLVSPATLFRDGALETFEADMRRQEQHLRGEIAESAYLLDGGHGYDPGSLILVVREEGNVHAFPRWACPALFLASFTSMAASAVLTVTGERERKERWQG